MKLVLIFMSDRPASTGTNPPWTPSKISTNRYIKGLVTDGYYFLLNQMLKSNVVDEALVLVESNVDPGCFITREGIPGFIVPEIAQADQFIEKGDVIWCRGGFRTWFTFLGEKKGRNWLMLYGANTGRERWKFWDVILNDLNEGMGRDVHGRISFHFRKPINPDVFKYMVLPAEYDLCIGASRIHDKKGQWLGVEALAKYQEIFGNDLKAVLPGPMSKGIHTNGILNRIKNSDLDVTLPGMVSRKDLAAIFNMSRVFIHAGAAGQNDRGPLEAMSCGCPVILSSRKHHAPFISRSVHNEVFSLCKSPEDLAYAIHNRVCMDERRIRSATKNYFEKENGFERVESSFGHLLRLMKEIRTPNSEKLWKRVKREFSMDGIPMVG